MIKKIISFLLISGGGTQEDYGYDLFDYLSGNLTSDEFFNSDYSSIEAPEEPDSDNRISENLPKIVGYASLSVEENVQIIVPQILSHLEEIRADQKQQRTSDFPTFLLSLLNNSKYGIEDPYPDEIFKLIMARVNQELIDNGVPPVNVEPEVRRTSCPIYWVEAEDTSNCLPTSLLYQATCSASGGSIFLDSQLLTAFGLTWQVQLNDNSCQTTETQVAENSLYNRITSGVRIDLPYDSCNTEVSQVDAEGKIYFKTFLKLTPSSTMSIFTKPSIKIPITCGFDDDFTIDLSLNVADSNFQSGSQSADGNYGFDMNLFETSSFLTKRDEIYFSVGEKIYFQIEPLLENVASNLRYQITSCGLTQGSNKFDFVQNGCRFRPLDVKKLIGSWNSKFEESNGFSFRGFVFSVDDTSEMTVSCKIHVCIDTSCSAAPTSDDCEQLSIANFIP